MEELSEITSSDVYYWQKEITSSDGYYWHKEIKNIDENIINIEEDTILKIDDVEVTGEQLKNLLKILIKEYPEIMV